MRLLRQGFLVLLVAIALMAVGCSKEPPTLNVVVEQVGSDLVINMHTTNFTIGKDGHVHIRLDDGPEAMPSKPVYSIGNIKPGKHKVFVELSDKDHNPIGVSQTVEIETK